MTRSKHSDHDSNKKKWIEITVRSFELCKMELSLSLDHFKQRNYTTATKHNLAQRFCLIVQPRLKTESSEHTGNSVCERTNMHTHTMFECDVKWKQEKRKKTTKTRKKTDHDNSHTYSYAEAAYWNTVVHIHANTYSYWVHHSYISRNECVCVCTQSIRCNEQRSDHRKTWNLSQRWTNGAHWQWRLLLHSYSDTAKVQLYSHFNELDQKTFMFACVRACPSVQPPHE